ncbi:MAG TPA: glycosyltransferase family 39 protein, partial [Pyrinomonadaceae bacterium]|nr:glycosyltransferase family 39 protein [Pyrinomonadaceae bacterium]
IPRRWRSEAPRLVKLVNSPPNKTEYRAVLIFILIAAVFVALRFWRLTSYGLWFDETFSLHAARLGSTELLKFVARDIVHPPLFYVALKGWITIGGESLLWLKLFPLITSILSIIPFVLLSRELRLKTSELNLSFFLFAVNPFLIYYAQELRMYSLLLCLVLWSLTLFLYFLNRHSKFPYLLLVVNLLLIYTHYFGWFVVFAEFCYVLVRRRDRLNYFLILVLALGACYVPWALVVREALIERRGLGENLNWLSRPGLSELVWYYATLNGNLLLRRTTALGFVLFATPVVVWIYRRWQSDDDFKLDFLLTFAFLPAALAFIASYVLPQSIWGERYLIVASVAYLILVSSAALRLPLTQLRTIAVVLMICWAGVSCYRNAMHARDRINWYELAQTMTNVEPHNSKVTVYTDAEFVASPIRFSLTSLGEQRFEVIAGNDMFGRPTRDILEDASNDDHFWMAYRPGEQSSQSPQEFLRARGCTIDSEFNVSALTQKVIYFPVICPR